MNDSRPTISSGAAGDNTVPGTTIRFFVSSTFADFQTERNVLQERVFPELHLLCAEAGFRLQPIDLRWGVSAAASTARQTLRICFNELERCRQLSPDFFLLILLGDRYGSHILPSELPATWVDKLRPHLSHDDLNRFDSSFRLDKNAEHPEYVLLPPEGGDALPVQLPATKVQQFLPHLSADDRTRFEASYRLDAQVVPPTYRLLSTTEPTDQTKKEAETLRQALLRAADEALRIVLAQAGRLAGLSAADQLLFDGSATHREIELGLLGVPAGTRHDQGVLCAMRHFGGTPTGPALQIFAEQGTGQPTPPQRLHKDILARLPEEQVVHYQVPWDGERGPAFELDSLAAAYLSLLRPKLNTIITNRTAARQQAATEGRDGITLANATFVAERAAHVEGRETELARIAAYLAGETGAGLPLVVTGPAGSGKSTLLAEAATRAAMRHPDAARVVRYIGVTPGTESLNSLLNDLRREIARTYDPPEPAPLPDESQLVSAVAAQLATLPVPPGRPLLLVLDALDQLGATTTRTDWLPRHLAPHVRVVVSVLADRPELGYLAGRLPAEQVLAVGSLGREAGRKMLHDLLGVAPARTLSSEQEEAVLAAFTASGLPLHLRLLASEARRWHSFDPPRLGAAPLPENTPDLLQTILKRLEAPEGNGSTLVARALGDLAAARFGLAEDELLDLLSCDAAVRAEQHELSPLSPPIDPHLPLPTALWARLYAEIELPLLTQHVADQQVGLYTFYHQQLREVVEARYLDVAERIERHRALADYFGEQPWRIGARQWNWRKVRELVTQSEWAQDRARAERALSELADEMEQSPTNIWADDQLEMIANIQADDRVGIIRVVEALKDHLNTEAYWRVGQRLLARALAARRAVGDRAGVAATLNNLGLLADNLGNKQEASRYYEQALAIFRETNDRVGEGTALHNLGTLAYDMGQSEEAERYFQQALAIRRGADDRAGEAATVNSLGALARDQSRPEEATQYYERALAIFRELGHRAGEAATLHNLGNLAYDQRHREEAERYFQQALAIRREVDDRAGEAATLRGLGNLAHDQGQLDDATRYYERALAMCREVGDRKGVAIALNSLGTLADDQKRHDEAARYYEQALAEFREVSDRKGEETSLHNLGTLARERGTMAHQLGRLDQAADYYEQAARYYEQMLAICREMGDRKGEGMTLYDLGTLAIEWGHPDEAVQFYKQALAARREVGDRKDVAVTLNSLGTLADDLGKLAHDRSNLDLELQFKKEAAQYYEQALALFREMHDAAGEAVTLNCLGNVARDLGRLEEARRYYEQALAIFEHVGAVSEARMVRGNLQTLRTSPAPSTPSVAPSAPEPPSAPRPLPPSMMPEPSSAPAVRTGAPDLSRRALLIAGGVATGVAVLGGVTWFATRGSISFPSTSTPSPSLPSPSQPTSASQPASVPTSLAALGFTGWVRDQTKFILPPTAQVPAGSFIMGSDPTKDPSAHHDELPQSSITIPSAYQIGKYSVTVAEYTLAIQAGVVSRPPDVPYISWQTQLQYVDHPVVAVTWFDAMNYTHWLSTLTGDTWLLPSEAQWEEAARGSDGRIYPWGNSWDSSRANTAVQGPGTTTTVGAYGSAGDTSPHGCHDMAGNVRNWCSTIYDTARFPYPYKPDDGREDATDTGSSRVLRGGGWHGNSDDARAAARFLSIGPSFAGNDIGFRLLRIGS